MSANNLSEIRHLLSKYYDGITTGAEEITLREYFTSSVDIPDDLEADRLLFSRLASTAEPELPFDLDERLQAKIDEWEATEKRATAIRKRIRLPRPAIITGIAASLLLLLSIGFHFMRPEQPSVPDEPTPEEVYAQTEKALLIFANAVDKSLKQMETVEETSAKVNRQLDAQLSRLDNI